MYSFSYACTWSADSVTLFPAEALARWEATATESKQQLEDALQRAGAADADSKACVSREVALREHM